MGCLVLGVLGAWQGAACTTATTAPSLCWQPGEAVLLCCVVPLTQLFFLSYQFLLLIFLLKQLSP